MVLHRRARRRRRCPVPVPGGVEAIDHRIHRRPVVARRGRLRGHGRRGCRDRLHGGRRLPPHGGARRRVHQPVWPGRPVVGEAIVGLGGAGRIGLHQRPRAARAGALLARGTRLRLRRRGICGHRRPGGRDLLTSPWSGRARGRLRAGGGGGRKLLALCGPRRGPRGPAPRPQPGATAVGGESVHRADPRRLGRLHHELTTAVPGLRDPDRPDRPH